MLSSPPNQPFVFPEDHLAMTLATRAFQAAAVGSVDRGGEFAVTDVWTRAGSDWKLSLRYVSRPEAFPAKP